MGAPVTSSNSLFSYAYAVVIHGIQGHGCCGQLQFEVKVTPCGNQTSCQSLTIAPGVGNTCEYGVGTFTSSNNYDSWTSWQVNQIDLSPCRGAATALLASFIVPALYIHGYYLPKKKGSNRWTDEPKGKNYDFRKWDKDVF